MLASPFGVAGIIAGIAQALDGSGEDRDLQHAVVPKNEEEFELVLKRLRDFSRGVLRLRDWEELLSAAERVIPRVQDLSNTSDQVGDHTLGMSLTELASKFVPSKRIEASELDLDTFRQSWSGRILGALLEGFGSMHTFENSQRLSFDDWIRLLTWFYDLSVYLNPPFYPAFTTKLCAMLDAESIDSVRLVNLIQRFEPIVIRQRVSHALLQKWKQTLESESADLAGQRAEFGPSDDPSDYDEWESKAGKFLSTAKAFQEWSRITEIESLSDLADLHESVIRPQEDDPNDGEEPDYEPTISGPYWTVDRILEDL